MLLHTLIAILLGILAGNFTGLIPGIHINLISAVAISYYAMTANIPPLLVAIFIISMSTTHTFVDCIPSIYLGAPDQSHILTALPGHAMLMKGDGHNAVKLTIIGSMFTLIMSILLFGLFMKSMSIMNNFLKDNIGIILAILAAIILLIQKDKINSALIFIISATLGIMVLSQDNLSNPLFHMLSGFFGVSLLLMSTKNKARIPMQNKKRLIIGTKTIKKSVLTASIAGFFAAFTPGFGTSQIMVIVQRIFNNSTKSFLILAGGMNTAGMIISLCSFFIIDKARNGSIVAIKSIIENISYIELGLLLIVAIIAGGIASISTIYMSRFFSSLVNKINYKNVVLCVIAFIVLMSLIFDGALGILILITSASIGILAECFGVGKNNLMGCLIVPVIMYLI
ncbi:MAG: tripartite tricarboxylate transporter permease [Nanoarchaeota archaeon]